MTAEEHLQRGRDAAKRQAHDEAVAEFTEAIRLEPGSAAGYFEREAAGGA